MTAQQPLARAGGALVSGAGLCLLLTVQVMHDHMRAVLILGMQAQPHIGLLQSSTCLASDSPHCSAPPDAEDTHAADRIWEVLHALTLPSVVRGWSLSARSSSLKGSAASVSASPRSRISLSWSLYCSMRASAAPPACHIR